jgi:hypothetical protein
MNITTKTGVVVTVTDPDASAGNPTAPFRNPSWTRARAITAAAQASDGELARLDEHLTGIWYDAETAGDHEASDRLFACCQATLDEKINRDYEANQTPETRAHLDQLCRRLLDSM